VVASIEAQPLDRAYCTPRRCFACPIAADVIRFERESLRDLVR